MRQSAYRFGEGRPDIMRALARSIAVLAVVLFLVGGTVQAAGFLLWAAAALVVVALLLHILERSAGRRIPR